MPEIQQKLATLTLYPVGTCGAGFGALALTYLLQKEGQAAAAPARPEYVSPLAPTPAHFPARARSVIFLFMEGGPSHLDTFDPKPELERRHMQEFVRRDRFASAIPSPCR